MHPPRFYFFEGRIMILRRFVIIFISLILLTGCSGMVFPSVRPTATDTAVPQPPTETPALRPTATPTIIPSASLPTMATPTWVAQGPGHIQVPILLYHWIETSPVDSRYYVPPYKFEAEIKLLHDWGYTSISTTMLVQAIMAGASLPPRPVIITFDDAHEDNYTNAFPIMKKYGFTGVLYLPYNYIGTNGYLTVDEVKTMTAAGWEVGSHTLSHPINFPTLDPASLRAEIVDSRKKLAALLGLPILTFAYPFGDGTNAAVDYVHFAGYIAGMGATGFTADQGPGNLFVLQRCEIEGWEDAKTMIRFLPWHGDPSFLPADTPTATTRPTRTPIPTYTQYPTKTP
jgi:peptidoglycan/xylan/chitin deacetylase (PgdA/CDA1 family)